MIESGDGYHPAPDRFGGEIACGGRDEVGSGAVGKGPVRGGGIQRLPVEEGFRQQNGNLPGEK